MLVLYSISNKGREATAKQCELYEMQDDEIALLKVKFDKDCECLSQESSQPAECRKKLRIEVYDMQLTKSH
jgi:hypothetical protein